MRNKRGQAWIGVLLLVFVAVMVVGGGLIAWKQGWFSKTETQAIQQQTTQQLTEAVQTGDVAQIKVYVRDMTNNDVNTKVAIPVYCQDSKGNFIIDATSSSASAEITGTTTRGETGTCWAFNSTYQSFPEPFTVSGEAEHILIDAYSTDVAGKYGGAIQFYDDTYSTGTDGAINISCGADGTDTFQKMKFTNNGTDTAYNLGGFYFDVIEDTNVSDVDVSGSIALFSMDHSSAKIVDSSLGTSVTGRKSKWDFVFEVDDDASESGNQPLLMYEADYLETGSVSVTADGDGCPTDANSDLISSYAFAKGYYRSSKENSVKFGHETDATTPTRIGGSTGDITGDTFRCSQ